MSHSENVRTISNASCIECSANLHSPDLYQRSVRLAKPYAANARSARKTLELTPDRPTNYYSVHPLPCVYHSVGHSVPDAMYFEI